MSLVVLTTAIVTPLALPVITETTIKYLIEAARKRITYWGTESISTTSNNYYLDPGGGGGSGFIPNRYSKVLILYDAVQNDINNDEVSIVKSNFSSASYFVYLSYADTQNSFFDDLHNADTLASNTLSVAFVGEGTTVTINGHQEPALLARNNDTITGDEIGTFYTNTKFHAVFLYSCYSMQTDGLARAFKDKGAEIVFGFNDKVETNLAREVVDLFWENYKDNATSLEEAYNKAKEDFEYVHQNFVGMVEHWLEKNQWAMRLILRILLDQNFRATVIALLELIAIYLGLGTDILPLILLILLATIVILLVIYGINYAVFPLAMRDYNGETTTKI